MDEDEVRAVSTRETVPSELKRLCALDYRLERARSHPSFVQPARKAQRDVRAAEGFSPAQSNTPPPSVGLTRPKERTKSTSGSTRGQEGLASRPLASPMNDRRSANGCCKTTNKKPPKDPLRSSIRNTENLDITGGMPDRTRGRRTSTRHPCVSFRSAALGSRERYDGQPRDLRYCRAACHSCDSRMRLNTSVSTVLLAAASCVCGNL